MPEDEVTPPEEKDRGLHRHGDLDPSKWDEQKAVTGRPNDTPADNSTFSSRSSNKPEPVVVEDTKQDPAEDKAVKPRSRRKSS
jgi:hypothetical protein